jgi:hypothetical protein
MLDRGAARPVGEPTALAAVRDEVLSGSAGGAAREITTRMAAIGRAARRRRART